MLVPAILFALTTVCASLVIFTASHRDDLKDGVFALAFAVLSIKAAVSWTIWRRSYE
jgi:hypothetical protein